MRKSAGLHWAALVPDFSLLDTMEFIITMRLEDFFLDDRCDCHFQLLMGVLVPILMSWLNIRTRFVGQAMTSPLLTSICANASVAALMGVTWLHGMAFGWPATPDFKCQCLYTHQDFAGPLVES